MNKSLALTTALLFALPLSSCAISDALTLGSMPVGEENAEYKVTVAGGVMASVKPKSAEESSYRYAFNIELKNALSVSSVRIERVNSDGNNILIIDDSENKTTAGNFQQQTPTGARSYLAGSGLGNIVWIGQSQSYNMTQEEAPWLYKNGSTRETYLITIKDLAGNETKFTQKTVINSQAKKVYLDLIQ